MTEEPVPSHKYLTGHYRADCPGPPVCTTLGHKVRTEPQWPLLTTFSVNLLSLSTHQHGPNGPHYLTHDQAVNMLYACIKAMDKAGDRK